MTSVHASTEEDSYLWIEMNNAEKRNDGSLDLRLYLYFGKTSEQKEAPCELRNLEAFYIKKGLGRPSSIKFCKAKIINSHNCCFIKINSPDENSYTLYVSGVKENGQRRCHYFAKTTFALFGKSLNRNYDDIPADEKDINRQFEILTVPEFHYWPQTGSSLKISASFNGSPAAFNPIHIKDVHGPEIKIMPGKDGEVSYVPPEDAELNRKGSTAFKNVIVTVRHYDAGDIYISSRTLIFHRSRYGNYRIGTGGVIFCFSLAAFFISMYFIRKRSVS